MSPMKYLLSLFKENLNSNSKLSLKEKMKYFTHFHFRILILTPIRNKKVFCDQQSCAAPLVSKI